MISEGFCNTEGDIFFGMQFNKNNTKLKYLYLFQIVIMFHNITVFSCNASYYCFNCIFNQINATLVSIRDFFQKHGLIDPNLLNGSVCEYTSQRNSFF